MIPSNIRKEHVVEAAAWIDENGVPVERWPTKYLVIIGTKEYPPKYVISIANISANNSELSHKLFNGGRETNERLEELGFQIVEFSSVQQIRSKWKGAPRYR